MVMVTTALLLPRQNLKQVDIADCLYLNDGKIPPFFSGVFFLETQLTQGVFF